jgi:hypothetical protein
MNNYDYKKEINEVIQAADNALYHLDEAERYLSSASNWGILDILGGGTISTLIKHSKLDNAKNCMQQAQYAVQGLKRELQDVNMINGINLDIGDFLTFADFFFDGFVADIMVQSKIRDAERQVQQAKQQIQYIRNQLTSY